MRPALEPGDWALCARVSERRGFRRGDVVVVEHPHRPGFEMVKRLTGVPGDVVADGRLLGSDEYWVEGDSPDESTDSRNFGPVAAVSLKERLLLIYWPASRRGLVRSR